MATFHVDYINGSNSNDGSAANPYATIVYALQTNSLGSGDEVKVKGSGLTVVDSACTWAEANGNNVLTTSKDNTSLLAVGDIVQINPPATELQDFAFARITGITATTITFHEELYVPGTLGTGNWTVKKIDEVILSSAGTFETWQQTDGQGVDIICGYDATFTNVIGRTYFRRDVGAGASSGTCFSTNTNTSNISGGNTSNFLNMGFLHWSNCIRGGFGGSHFGDNLMAYQASNDMFGYFGSMTKKGTGANEIIVNSCNGRYWSWAYSAPDVDALGYGYVTNTKVFAAQRTPILQDTYLGDITVWNPGQAAHGGAFGTTIMLRLLSGGVNGALTICGPNQARGGFSKSSIIYGVESRKVNANIKHTSFTRLTGGTTDSYYSWWDTDEEETGPGTIIIKAPTGYDVTTEPINTNRQSKAWLSGNNYILIDDNHNWYAAQGCLLTTDVGDTGVNSKKMFFGTKQGVYAMSDTYAPTLGFIKGPTAPTSITMRYKIEVGNTLTNINCRFIQQLGQTYDATNSRTLSSTTWANETFTFTSSLGYEKTPEGSFFPLALKCTNPDNQVLYIDSLTVNY